MKKKMIVASLAICLMTVGIGTVNAYQQRGENYGCQCRAGEEVNGPGFSQQQREPRLEMLAEILDLTEEQQEKIKAIHEEAREAHQESRQKMQEYREQLRDLAGAETVDEDALRDLAEKKAALETELAISRAQVERETLAVMTPEQQELAEKLRSARHKSRPHHGKRDNGMM